MKSIKESKQDAIRSMTKEQVLLILLKKKGNFFQQIHELTEEEHRRHQCHRPLEEITPLIKKKQVLMLCLADIEKALKPIKNHWTEHKQDGSSETEAIQKEITTLEKILKEIIQIDDANKQLMEQRLTNF